MAKALQFTFGLALFLGVEFFRVYLIMPFGSQQSDTIDTAYFLHTNVLYFRIIALLVMVIPAIYFFQYGTKLAKGLVILGLVAAAVVAYLFNFRLVADKIFYQPEHKIFSTVSSDNKIKNEDLVIGVFHNGAAKAYPIELIGYHHQVRDNVGGMPVMVTYCTVCRTGRVFSPLVDGKDEQFRLVGMDHFNAMFEDATTGSWWRQVTGEAVAGTLKGKTLTEIPTAQMSLAAWIRKYPNSLIMQPDASFLEEYDHLKSYDEGKSKGDLTRRDSLSWNEKSWVVGVTLLGKARAYDWNDIVSSKVINDTLAGIPIVVAVEGDSASFHVWQRDTLSFSWDAGRLALKDSPTGSFWNWEGVCVDGPLKEKTLPVLQSYQEFWHSWRTFRPGTTRYGISN
jgi:hypothetical protein